MIVKQLEPWLRKLSGSTQWTVEESSEMIILQERELTSEIMLKCSKQITDSYSTVRKRPRAQKVEK